MEALNKRAAIEDIEIEIFGALSYLENLEQNARENNISYLFPILEDDTIQRLIKSRRKLRELRGY